MGKFSASGGFIKSFTRDVPKHASLSFELMLLISAIHQHPWASVSAHLFIITLFSYVVIWAFSTNVPLTVYYTSVRWLQITRTCSSRSAPPAPCCWLKTASRPWTLLGSLWRPTGDRPCWVQGWEWRGSPELQHRWNLNARLLKLDPDVSNAAVSWGVMLNRNLWAGASHMNSAPQ